MQALPPLVSCIMPTYNRRLFVPHAIRYFLQQDYANKELIILDDGSDCIEDLVPGIAGIVYFKLDGKLTLGEKLNRACEYAKGTIIVHWDDDDWYAPNRISYQVQELIKEQTDICGINNLLYYDYKGEIAYNYIYPGHLKKWLLGSSLCYQKAFWENHKFSHINVGMDGLFVWSTSPDRVTVLKDNSFAVHIIHSNNISPKQTSGPWWHPYPVKRLESLMKEDWGYYKNGLTEQSIGFAANRPTPKVVPVDRTDQVKPYRNVFACLVHENKDCIIDLVRNLHYLDPGSKIILYNGGTDKLLSNTFDYSLFNAFVHPAPRPQKHGYLHTFALDCMEFARINFEFDTFTIVDSDQLGVQTGYSQYLAAKLPSLEKIGLLSSEPQHVPPTSKTNFVALQAHKEYELWKPLLDDFKDGSQYFVHWTFWPGTVFTAHAVNDLLKLFDTNEKLKAVMAKTQIWATEEVIFPTLVKLLGYEVVANPCDSSYVKYKVNYRINDIQKALQNPNVFWAHPVERNYDDPSRKYIRENLEHYVKQVQPSSPIETNTLFSFTKLLDNSKKIEGWLSDNEADLIISTTMEVCAKETGAIVEIGSYHGKATVLLAETAKYFGQGCKIYSIDPHDGVLGAKDQGLQKVKPSYQSFQQTLSAHGLTDTVVDIVKKPYEVHWDSPISFLYIDGLHDYPSVAKDFLHYADYLLPKSYIAFHDYADYYPGVMAFVNELLQNKTYSIFSKADSLIILKKGT